ncbi:MAG: transglutaminase-like domain-containing protein [Thermodesulfovibrionales bacterium]
MKRLISLLLLLFFASQVYAKERAVEIINEFKLNVPESAKHVRLWIPYPMSDENQDIYDVHIIGNFSYSSIYREAKYGNTILYAEWKEPVSERILKYTFKVKRKEQITRNFPKKELNFSRKEMEKYLRPAKFLPIDGKVKDYAEKITEDKTTVLQKATAIYDWIVENMHRDPNVKGCGFGEVERLLETRGGKCADIHSVFVALARASGIPAREVFGIRIPKGKEGDMTKAQHCWAEFYLPGYGWVVVDPADVRKAILEQKLTLDQARPLREYYFGAVDENRIAFGTGRDIILNPEQKGEPLNYFMYPYAEVDGKPLNEDLYGFNIGYKISFRELDQ